MRGLAIIIGLSAISACDKKPEKDVLVSAPVDVDAGGDKHAALSWLTTSHLAPNGSTIKLEAEALKNGGPREPIEITYVKANAPASLFLASKNGDNGDVNDVAFLAFATENMARVSVRHVKTLGSKVVGSQAVTPINCPEGFVLKNPPDEGMVTLCIPLVNAVVPNFLTPTDNEGAYVHEITVSAKTGNKSPTVLATKLASRVVIPDADLSVGPSEDLKKLSLRDRTTIATNDLVGNPRRDFRALRVFGSVAPGVQTEWRVTLTNVRMTLEEEVFFEQPVTRGASLAKPLVSRGSTFFKRRSEIDSNSDFRLRATIGQGTTPFAVRAGNVSTEILAPIADGSAPLDLYLIPDFGSDLASRVFTEYVRPMSPTFCPTLQTAFRAEEWRAARLTPGYVACEAVKRTKVADAADAIRLGITTPIETFYGSFAYLPRMAGKVLGGTNGVLSLRVGLSGHIKVEVRNPNLDNVFTTVGETNLSYSYLLPTVLDEMEGLIRTGKAPPGLDTILNSMQRKGVMELPKRDGSLPAFPFQGVDNDTTFF